jgi:hypothetical protein
MIETGRKGYPNAYTPYSWMGVNYNRHLDTKSISKLIRKELKLLYPSCKFSITTKYNHIAICLMVTNRTPFEVDANINYDLLASRDYWSTNKEIQERFKNIRHEMYLSVNQFYIDKASLLNKGAKEMFAKIKDMLDSFNFDDSDSQTDYFHTNFYVGLSVGRWDKPLVII